MRKKKSREIKELNLHQIPAALNAGIIKNTGEMLWDRNVFSAAQGHGFAAERINHFYDSVMLKNPRLTGGNNVKNGPDRAVGSRYIQTKFHSTASGTVESAFDSSGYRYPGMQLEVPSDQYDRCLELFEARIAAGEVPGAEPGDAAEIVKRSYVDYSTAREVAEFGNIRGILFDASSGMISAALTTGIGSIIIYAFSYWQTGDHKTAAANMTEAVPKIFFISLTSGIIAGQIARTALPNMLSGSLQGIFTAETARAASGNIISGISVLAAYTAYDLFNVIENRLHVNTLIRNIGKNSFSVGGSLMLSELGDGPVSSFLWAVAGGIAGRMIGDAVFGYKEKDIRMKTEEFFRSLEKYFVNYSGLVPKEWEYIDYTKIEKFMKSEEALSFLMEDTGVLTGKVYKILEPQIEQIKKSRETVTAETVENDCLNSIEIIEKNIKEQRDRLEEKSLEFRNHLLGDFV